MVSSFRAWVRRLVAGSARPTSKARRSTVKHTASYRPRLEALEDRTTPVIVDMLPHPSTAIINDAIFSHFHGISGGGGGADKFLSLDTGTGIEEGYNTEAPLDLDAKEPTRVFPLSRFPTVNIGGVLYREFTLDINESSSGGGEYIALNDLRVYAHNTSTLSGYVGGVLGGQSPLYDMDAGPLGDVTVLLDGADGGSVDVIVLIRDDAFDAARATFGPDPFVYLYSRFGDTSEITPGDLPPGTDPAWFRADDGDETWSANPGSLYPLVADVQVSKTDGQTVAVPGETVTYTITVTNTGPTTVTSLNFSDILPSDPVLGPLLLSPTFQNWSAGTFNVTQTDNTFSGTWDNLNLAAGQSVTVELTGIVNPPATASMTLTNVVSAFPVGIADPTPNNNTASDTDALQPVADLSIVKDDFSTTVVAGTTVTYDVTVSNAGPSTITSVQLTDTSSPDLGPLSYTGLPPGAVFDPGTGTLSGITLAAGDSISFQVSGLVPSSATGLLTNTITVFPPAGVIDPNTGNNTFTDIDVLTPQADLQITKSDVNDILHPGDAVDYTITVENLGPSDVIGAHVTDIFPTVIISHAWEVTTATPGATATPSTGGVADDLDSFVNIPAGGVIIFTVHRVIDPALTTTQLLSNTARVESPIDPNPENNESTHVDTIVVEVIHVDLMVEKSHFPAIGTPGESVTYTITVRNHGQVDAVGASVVDSFLGLPGFSAFDSMSWVVASSSGASNITPMSDTGPLNATFDLLVDGFITFTITGEINASAAGTIVNTVQVFPPPGTTDPDADNVATDQVPLEAVADLAVTKTDGLTTITRGSPIEYTVTVTNNGPSTLTSLTLTDTVPPTITLDSVQPYTPSEGVYNSATGEWTGLNLATGESVTLTIRGTVSSTAVGTIVNTVVVAPPPGTTDPDPTNNTATDQTQVNVVADLAIFKRSPQRVVTPGGLLTYRIIVINRGPDTVNRLRLIESLPAGFTPLSFTPSAGVFNRLTGVWRGLNLAAGERVVLTITGRVTATTPRVMVNTARVVAPGILDPDLSNNRAVLRLFPVGVSPISKRWLIASSW